MSDKLSFFEEYLEKCRSKNRFRKLRNFYSVSASRIFANGRELINFSSNDYMGLSSSKEMNVSSNQASNGSTASRLVCGNSKDIEELEQALAKWKKKEASLLFNSGYQANSTLIPAIVDRKCIIFSDKLNHASIIDGIKLSGARHLRFQHNDYEQLEALLKKHEKDQCRKLIVSETLFSMDGDYADLKKLTVLAETYNCLLYIDDAHGSGISGENGIGPAGPWMDKIDFYISTFGKAHGSFGAYCACTQLLKDYLINSARGLIFSTALPPSVIAANSTSVKLIQNMDEARVKLAQNIAHIRGFLKENKFHSIESNSPIIPIIIGSEEKTLKLSGYLFENDIFAIAIRPPTVPENTCRIRITVSSEHSKEDINKLTGSLKSWKENLASAP